MAGHSDGCIGQRPERGEVCFQFLVSGRYCRHFLMRVRGGAAMAGHMFDTARNPCPRQPVKNCPAQRRHPQRFRPQCPVADYVMCSRLAHIQRRMAINGNPGFCQFDAQRFCIGPRRFDRGGRGNVIQPVKYFAIGKTCPMRRPQAGHAPPFLVNADEQVIAPVQFAQGISQSAQLFRRFAIAAKQNVASRVRFPKERTFLWCKRQARSAEDCRCHGWKVAGTHRFCKAFSTAGCVKNGWFKRLMISGPPIGDTLPSSLFHLTRQPVIAQGIAQRLG